MEKIISLKNKRIREIILLAKPGERRAKNLIVIEGYREIAMAYHAGVQLKEIYYSTEVNLHPEAYSIINTIPQKFEISRQIFEKIAYRDHSDGLIAIAATQYLTLKDITLTQNPLILIMESVEKPGNLGAVLRTADAAAIDALLICDPQTDLFNPNVIRSSLGCIFTRQVVVCSTSDAIGFLKQKNIKCFAAAVNASIYYQDTDFTIPCAIVMGSESSGLSEDWLKHADQQIKIPMNGMVDSLNVSTSAAILIFEAKRQRGFK